MKSEDHSEWDWDQDELDQVAARLVDGQTEIAYDELVSLLPDAESNREMMSSLVDDLAKTGVSVVTDEELEASERERSTSVLTDLENIPADDLLSVYLAEMSQEPLLTHGEEIELAQRIELARQTEKMLQETDYTAAEFTRMQAQVEAGQEAREHLSRANTRLVVSIAKRYRGYGIPFTDLIQDGNVGLMRAVDRYDHRTGNRFSTYATWWIRQAVTRSLANQGRVIRIPVHMGGRMREMAQIAQRMELESGQKPTPEEIAVAMNETPAKVRQMLQWANRPISLDQPVGDEGDVELGDFVEDENTAQPDEMADINLLNDTLEVLLASLTPREARILRLRYGLRDGKTRTLHQVAGKFGLSRERVRQIEREAIAKIRLVAPDLRLQHFLEPN